MIRSLLCLVLIGLSAPGIAQRLDRVDPPNWWVGMEHDTVELLLYGQDLAGLKPRFDPPGPVVLSANSFGSTTHLFVQVHIPAEARVGPYRLVASGLRGQASIDWALEERLPGEGRYQGFGPQDVLYLITPDRFADGSPANNYRTEAPPGAEHLELEFARAEPGHWHGGDLMGILQHLDYLADLGITTIWINPFLENAGRGSYHGYAATDLYRVDPRFGHVDVYAELVEAAHLKGLKVVFDHVNNHVGVRHPWVADPPTPTWFHGTVDAHERDPHHLTALLDPYAPQALRDQLHQGWFADAMPDLNQRDPYVARYLIQQTLWWVERSGLDGIREDTWPYSYPDFSARWMLAIAREYPDLTVVGECWGNTAFTAAFQGPAFDGSVASGQMQNKPNVPNSAEHQEKASSSANPETTRLNVLPSVMDFGLMEAFDRYLLGQSTLYPVHERLATDGMFADPAMLVTFLGNHDMARAIDRAKGDADRYKVALFALLTVRGIPQLLYGEEIGMRAALDPDRPDPNEHTALRRDFPGGFPHGMDAQGQDVPDDPDADFRSAFTAEGRTPRENALFDFTRALLQLRKAHPALQHGRMVQLTPRWDGVWAWLRQTENESILCVVNSGSTAQTIAPEYLHPLWDDLGWNERSITFQDLFTERTLSAATPLELPAYGTAVFLVKP